MTPNLTIRYLGGITFESSHTKTGAKILSDVATTPEGAAKSYNPGEILASALGSWAGSMVALYGLKNAIDMSGLTIDVAFEHDEKTDIALITLNFAMPQHDYSPKDKKVIVKYAETCPVGKMLAESVHKKMHFNWPDA